jgi:flagellar L-ring protein precursor FlgH
MANLLILGMAAFIVIILQGCVADRTGNRLQSAEKIAAPYESGSIFKAGINERPLFEERRARNVGDAIVMNVVDSGNGGKKPASDKKSDKAKGSGADGSGDEEVGRRRSEEGDEDLTNISNEALLGTVPMVVTEVMDNGNLIVEGGRQVNVDEDHKYLHVTGVVDPFNITGGNIVQSTQMTNVLVTIDHVRVRGDGTTSRINEGNSIFGNYFHSVNPR